MEKKGKKLVQISLRIEEDKLKEYKKWLIDEGYKSINEHLNKVIDKILKSNSKDQCTHGEVYSNDRKRTMDDRGNRANS
jgi:hypothetical protein